MFIYSVTHIPTKRFYIGYHNGPIKTINSELDPMNMFIGQTTGYNDNYIMTNIVKELLVKVGDLSEAKQYLANLAKHYESNPQFLGIQLDKEKVVESKQQPSSDEKVSPTQLRKSIDKV